MTELALSSFQEPTEPTRPRQIAPLYRPFSRHKDRTRCSLRAAMSLGAAFVAVAVLIIAVVPTSAMWFSTINDLSGAAGDSIGEQAATFRASVVSRSRDQISQTMSVLVNCCNLISGLLPRYAMGNFTGAHEDVLHDTLAPLSVIYPQIGKSGMMVAWVNDYGEHMYSEKIVHVPSHYGIFDSQLSPDMHYYLYNDSVPTKVELPEKKIVGYNLTREKWWIKGTDPAAQEGFAWTGPYMSKAPGDGIVIALTSQLLLKNGTLVGLTQLTYSINYLVSYFDGFRPTAGGWGMLVSDNGELIAATSGYPVVNETSLSLLPMTSSPNETIRKIAELWISKSSEGAMRSGTLRELSFVLDDTLFVDTSAISQPGGLHLWLVLVTPRVDFFGNLDSNNDRVKSVAMLTLGILIAGEAVVLVAILFLSIAGGINLLTPLLGVLDQLHQVSNMNIVQNSRSVHKTRSRILEIEMIQDEAIKMQESLEAFSKYVPTIVVQFLIRNKINPVVGVEQMHATILFLDIVSFTQSMDTHGAPLIISILEIMFQEFSTILTGNGAIIDKYIGDSIMAVWGCPEKITTPEIRSCKAVTEIQLSLERMNHKFRAQHGFAMAIRIGWHSGEVQAGNVGCHLRLNYTVLGSNVNLAARLEQLNKELGTICCVSDSIREQCEPQFVFRCLGTTKIRGFSKEITVHEFLGPAENTSGRSDLEDYKEIDHYLRNSNTEAAVPLLKGYVIAHNEDVTAAKVLARTQQKLLTENETEE